MLIIGVDPGASSSPTVIAVIDTANGALTGMTPNKLIDVYSIHPCNNALSFRDRIKLIANTLNLFVKCVNPYKIVIEKSFYMGVANISHLKLLGAIECTLSHLDAEKIAYVAPTSVKKFMGGGKLEKEQVAANLLEKFPSKADKNLIQSYIDKKEFDKTDAIAIALSGA